MREGRTPEDLDRRCGGEHPGGDRKRESWQNVGRVGVLGRSRASRAREDEGVGGARPAVGGGRPGGYGSETETTAWVQ